jgi:hypothetical protein
MLLRQPDSEYGPFAYFTVYFDASVMLLHDTVRQRQAKPCALTDRFGGKKRIKNPADMLW